MLFGMFKNNKNKIKECYMTNRDKFHSNFSLNEKIKTFILYRTGQSKKKMGVWNIASRLFIDC